MNPTTYIEAALATAISISSLLTLKKEKKKYGTGLAAKTAHTASRYRLLWLLAYATATPAAITLHTLRLTEWFYTGIGRLLLWTTKKTFYTTLGLILWLTIKTIRLIKLIGEKTWGYFA